MTPSHERDAGGCANPVDAAVLADYWAGVLAESEEAAVEEHLLACDDCGARLRDVITLAEGVRSLARDADLRMVVSDTFLRQAAENGLRIRQYAPSRGGSVQCTVTADDDILIGRLAADLTGVTQADLSFCDETGTEQLRLRDIPVRAGAAEVIVNESMVFARAAPSHTMIARLIAIDRAGGERLLGEYTFNHFRSLPGPGSR